MTERGSSEIETGTPSPRDEPQRLDEGHPLYQERGPIVVSPAEYANLQLELGRRGAKSLALRKARDEFFSPPKAVGYVKGVDPVGRVEISSEPVVYLHRDDGAFAFRPSESANAVLAHLDITDLMNELWIRLLANVGLLAGVIAPECFGWPAGTRAVIRR